MISKTKSMIAILVVAAFGYAPIGAAQAADCKSGHSSVRAFNKSVKTTKKTKQSLRVKSTKKKARVATSWK